ITVVAKGLAPELVHCDVKAGMAALKVTLPDAQRIAGRVVDDQGKPVAKAYVHAGEWRGLEPLSWSAETDADGRFAWIDAPADAVGSYVRIEANGYKPAISPPVKSGSATFSAALERGDDVTGTLHAPDGKPVGGASVHLALPGTQVNIYSNHIEHSDTLR